MDFNFMNLEFNFTFNATYSILSVNIMNLSLNSVMRTEVE